MNKRQKEVAKAKLDAEKQVLDELKKQYKLAAKDIANKIEFHQGRINAILKDWDNLDANERTVLQSQIYRKQFQESLKGQIDTIVDGMNKGQYKTISDYLKESYDNGFLGSMYDIHGQGIPMIIPIDQKAIVKAATLNPKISNKLYGKYTNGLKRRIRAEISRGISTASTYHDIARNLDKAANIGYNKAATIARTEGHKVQQGAHYDAQAAAKDRGADILKQWDSALDSDTRKTHQEADGQIRELDEPYDVGGHKAMYPSDFGVAAEDINCRCTSNQRARWVLGQGELDTLKKRAEYFGLDKRDQFDTFKSSYMNATKSDINDTDIKAIFDYMSPKSYVVNEKLRNGTKLTSEESRFIINLDRALEKMPKYSGTLRRSLDFSSKDEMTAFLAVHAISKIVDYDEYLSTTKGEVYNPEGQIQIYIQDSRNGNDISKFNSSENEVLYSRNSKFEVINVVEQDGLHYILLKEKDEKHE